MGLHSWHPNCCHGFTVPTKPNHQEATPAEPVGSHAVVTNRRKFWQGLEQNITSRVSPNVSYSVSACVGVSGSSHGPSDVLATLKLETRDSGTSFLCVGK